MGNTASSRFTNSMFPLYARSRYAVSKVIEMPSGPKMHGYVKQKESRFLCFFFGFTGGYSGWIIGRGQLRHDFELSKNRELLKLKNNVGK